MMIAHQVTGYDKGTERLTHRFDVPADHMPELRLLAHVEPEDTDAIGSYPLSDEEARTVAMRLSLQMVVDRCDWFLEPYNPH